MKDGEAVEEIKKRTPRTAIREQCMNCVGGVRKDVVECGGHGEGQFDYCHFYPHRLGKGRASVRTIRKFCLHCMNGTAELVFHCYSVSCPVWQYRMGKNPACKRKPLTASEKAKKVALLAVNIPPKRRSIPPKVG